MHHGYVEERRAGGRARNRAAFAEHPGRADQPVASRRNVGDHLVHIVEYFPTQPFLFVAEELVANPLDVRARGLRNARNEVHFRIGALNRRGAMLELIRRLGGSRNPRRSAEVNMHVAIALLTCTNRRGLHVVAAAEYRRSSGKAGLLRRLFRESANDIRALDQRRELFHVDSRQRQYAQPGFLLQVEPVAGSAGKFRYHLARTAELEIAVDVQNAKRVLVDFRAFLLEPDDLCNAVLAHDGRSGEQRKNALAAEFVHNALRLLFRTPVHPGDIRV
ncbi:hypothetical protein SDC9_104407 [bioreactor metagenome]|uniref:Uncharacterized protein n=1 Tax=bioreactor metagenome TaxID=1076179 RepID=A0A645AWG3_9ZZZZ